MSRSRQTKAAAEYCTQAGVPTSPSLLEKMRGRGPDDPRGCGPDFWRDDRNLCWYDQQALDRYIAQRLAVRRFRAPAPQPQNFKRAG